MVANASACPVDVVDVFVEVATDNAGTEYHPKGGTVAVEPGTSDKGLISLYLASEGFPDLCRRLGIEPRDPHGTAQAYTGVPEQNDEYLITAEELARYAEARGIMLVTASTEPQPAQHMGEEEPTAQPVGIEPAPNAGPIPGDLPRVAVGQLAVKAAWELEFETERVATAPEVMKRLQSWADEGKEPEYLIRSDRKRRRVIWRTAAGHEKDYGEEACGKAIKRWIDSRRSQDSSDASQTLSPLTKAPTLK